MITSIISIFALCVSQGALVGAQASDPQLVGTWTTKSKKVLTGPGFYNPVTDRLIEPELTGISYSFTADGHYEEAYYRAVANPQQPACPSSVMQWQHGTYDLPGNGSIILTPIGVDGRQLSSTPCTWDQAIYTRYEQPEFMKSYEVLTDPYHNIPRLNLFQFDGSPMQPMYLVMSPPQMLPTQTLNPTSTQSGAAATGKTRAKRQLDEERTASFVEGIIPVARDPLDVDTVWWIGVGLTALGTVMYMAPSSITRRERTS